ncbi:predicted protein [Naegleria gruberi]|uniref:Predicted protein n=1 Tax=Naegleria gruberi TaxID=5762 RepID=D2VV51_NAEGR|nr:uncharacterized protein NAEGRDRAFT_72893 [Naegleria gruberi]EFC39246.1 predicted protein [Naegleria gruberi]|eukprot:XP_002671990.1 predicted protein [Naegleria gruberi strain NEG-M]
MARSHNKFVKHNGYTSSDEHYRKEYRKSDRKAFRKTSRDVFTNDIISIVNKLDEIKPSKPERHVMCPMCQAICERHYKEIDLTYENGIIDHVNEEIKVQKQKIKQQSKEEKFIQMCKSRSEHKKKKIIKKIERNGGLNELSTNQINSIVHSNTTNNNTEIISESDETDSETELHLEKLKREKLKKQYLYKCSAKEIERYDEKQSPQVFKFVRKMKNK